MKINIGEKLLSIEKFLLGQKSVLTFEGACEFTGYMYKLTHQNKVPFSKAHGENIYFSREELEKCLLKNLLKT